MGESVTKMTDQVSSEDPAVTRFRDYLRIRSVHPNINYDEAVKFIKQQAKGLDLLWMVYSCAPGKPVVVLTWPGKEPDLQSVLLNSHMDVVPVFPEKWSHDPFGAEKDDQGNIFGRGAQDMKSIAIQYIEAIRKLKDNDVRLKRTVHISFVPDEESGREGMRLFVNTPEFRSLNVGCSLDEARSCPDDAFFVYYGERTIWRPVVKCTGNTGHGSSLVKGTAMEKARIVINKFMDWRQQEEDKLLSNPELTISDVTTVNLTMINGGVQENVIPSEIELKFDIRLCPTEDFEAISNKIDQFCQEAGEGTILSYTLKEPVVPPTKIDETNHWWTAFNDASNKMGLKLKPIITPGATDSRYLRKSGISAFGFSPMCNTPTLLHDNDEYLNEKIFLQGIDIYYEIIQALANL